MLPGDLQPSYFSDRGYVVFHAQGPRSAESLHPHFHAEYLLCLQVHGSEACHVTGKLHHFAPGDLVLINPLQVHTGNTQGTAELEYISLYIDPELLREIARGVTPTSEHQPEFTNIQIPSDPVVRAKFAALLQRCQTHVSGEPDSYGEREALIHELIGHVLIHYSNLSEPRLLPTNRVRNRNVSRAIAFLHSRNPSDTKRLDLHALAAIAGLSKYHFLRQFRAAVGMTPGAYVRTLKLCHAAQMLRKSPTSISTVARAIGFCDHASFTRAFSRHLGMTPSRYQRLHRPRSGTP